MNHIINYLQSPDGLRMTAFIAPSIILIAFIHRLLKKKASPVRTLQEVESAPWYAEDYKKFLISKINAAQTMEQLMAEMILIDRYPFKPFRQPISRFTINKYYIEILDAYAAKEDELTKIPLELCKN